MRTIKRLAIGTLFVLNAFSAITASANTENHYWMLSPQKEYALGEQLMSEKNYPLAFSHFANAKAAGNKYAGVMMAIFYNQGLGHKKASTAIASALLDEAEADLKTLPVKQFLLRQQSAYPELNVSRLLAKLVPN